MSKVKIIDKNETENNSNANYVNNDDNSDESIAEVKKTENIIENESDQNSKNYVTSQKDKAKFSSKDRGNTKKSNKDIKQREEKSIDKNTPKAKKEIKLSKAEIAEAKADKLVNVILIVLAIVIIGGITGWIIYKKSIVPPIVATPETFEQIYAKTLAGYETENNYKYEGYVFVKEIDGLWTTKIMKNTVVNKSNTKSQEIAISLYFAPRDMTNISQDVNISALMNKNTIYTSFEAFNNPDYAIAGVELRKIIGNESMIIRRNAATAIYGNDSGKYPFANCDNVTSKIGVIEFKIGNESSIVGKEGCVVLTGTDGRDLIRVADKFMLMILGIVKN